MPPMKVGSAGNNACNETQVQTRGTIVRGPSDKVMINFLRFLNGVWPGARRALSDHPGNAARPALRPGDVIFEVAGCGRTLVAWALVGPGTAPLLAFTG